MTLHDPWQNRAGCASPEPYCKHLRAGRGSPDLARIGPRLQRERDGGDLRSRVLARSGDPRRVQFFRTCGTAWNRTWSPIRETIPDSKQCSSDVHLRSRHSHCGTWWSHSARWRTGPPRPAVPHNCCFSNYALTGGKAVRCSRVYRYDRNAPHVTTDRPAVGPDGTCSPEKGRPAVSDNVSLWTTITKRCGRSDDGQDGRCLR